jgi:hypothetical protein
MPQLRHANSSVVACERAGGICWPEIGRFAGFGAERPVDSLETVTAPNRPMAESRFALI